MMNELHDQIRISCEEMVSDADVAQMEHERGEHEREERERWASLEQEHGRLMSEGDWVRHSLDYNTYLAQVWKD